MIVALSILALLLSAIPVLMWLANLPRFQTLRPSRDLSGSDTVVDGDSLPKISVLIPARDEAAGIETCVRHALASESVCVEVLVLDDDSSDETADIVRRIAAGDSRVRLISGAPLPAGWNGKQHACKQLAEAAQYERLAFLDADVRLLPHALAELNCRLEQHQLGLVSAFPYQVTETWLERWLIPMMHFILLSYLPFSRMQTMGDPSLAAGCGQLFLADRNAYIQAGTHEAIHDSRHDGIKLPRAFREAGLMTDVIDGTELASCRMYQNAGEVIRGVMKNANEGIANPRLIVIFTVLLLGCSLLPLVTLTIAIDSGDVVAMIISAIALALAHVPRSLATMKLGQSIQGVIFHIPATIFFVALQWGAMLLQLSGRTIAWRGRV
ncbi:glycosyltransferase [Rhodopirellula sp. MGV]|uniref:glycosyltransferase n=1 Tax=Rhodopirellula sp. MGV TaxID=2023130 RepID=UPI001E5FEA4A|nr:glycosyltransferase [Rhodopirellula sp. MGV]